MTELFKKIKGFSIATIIVATVVGILFIAFPAKCLQYISLVVGISLIVIGAISIVAYVVRQDFILPLILGIIVMIFGIVICVKYKAIVSIIVVIFGIFILASGIADMATSIRSLVTLRKSGWLTLVLSVISIIFGIVAITKSNDLTDNIIRFIGCALIVYAVLDLATLLQINTFSKKIKKNVAQVSDIEVDATEQPDINSMPPLQPPKR